MRTVWIILLGVSLLLAGTQSGDAWLVQGGAAAPSCTGYQLIYTVSTALSYTVSTALSFTCN